MHRRDKHYTWWTSSAFFPGIRSLDLRFDMGSVKEYLLPYQKQLAPTPVNLQNLRLYIDDFEDLEDEYYGEQAKNLLRCLGGQNVEKLSLILDLHDCELGMDIDKDFGREPNWRKWTLAFGKDALPRLSTIKFEFAVDISEPVHERSLWVSTDYVGSSKSATLKHSFIHRITLNNSRWTSRKARQSRHSRLSYATASGILVSSVISTRIPEPSTKTTIIASCLHMRRAKSFCKSGCKR